MHWRLSGERPACRPNATVGPVRINVTGRADEVTCRRCLAIMARAAKSLTPQKVRR